MSISVWRASLTVHKPHMLLLLSDDTCSQRATAHKSLVQGGQPASAALWCTATPSRPSTAAKSIILHPWTDTAYSSTALRSSMTLAFHLAPTLPPLSPARSWGCHNRTGLYCTGLYGISSVLLAHVPPWRLVSSGLAWPVHRLASPRALRPMSCRANPSWSCHHHIGTVPFCGRGGEPPHQEPPAGSTCGPVRYWIWHMDGRLCVPQQKRPGLLAALQLSVDIAPTRYPQYPYYSIAHFNCTGTVN